MRTDWIVHDKGINLYLENLDEGVRLTVYPWTATEKAERIATDLNSHAALAEALERALNFAMSMHSIFADSNFTDRYDDAGRCKRMIETIESALNAAKVTK